MKPGAQVVDLVGVKGSIIQAVETGNALDTRDPLVTKNHPMAGLAKAGYERALLIFIRGPT